MRIDDQCPDLMALDTYAAELFPVLRKVIFNSCTLTADAYQVPSQLYNLLTDTVRKLEVTDFSSQRLPSFVQTVAEKSASRLTHISISQHFLGQVDNLDAIANLIRQCPELQRHRPSRRRYAVERGRSIHVSPAA
ncbi:hypothetical protein FRB93_010593 [Tulasnella sp. JGI-2019a]|nr:hypothetical protein FRB93_010593 [Tulasnella sp. JGI-2019a]